MDNNWFERLLLDIFRPQNEGGMLNEANEMVLASNLKSMGITECSYWPVATDYISYVYFCFSLSGMCCMFNFL